MDILRQGDIAEGGDLRKKDTHYHTQSSSMRGQARIEGGRLRVRSNREETRLSILE